MMQHARRALQSPHARIDRDEIYDILDEIRAASYGETEGMGNSAAADADSEPVSQSRLKAILVRVGELVGYPLVVIALPLIFILSLLTGPVRPLDWCVNLVRRPFGLGTSATHCEITSN